MDYAQKGTRLQICERRVGMTPIEEQEMNEETKAVLDKHALWLRDEPGGARANLAGANLTDANLTHVYLADVNLADAILTHVYLADVNLADANLTGAKLTFAKLTHVNLADANLTHANLACADLTGVNLTHANLAGANLTDAHLTGADLTGADLACANLARADLTRANLTDASLTGANLTGADLTRANLTDASLTGANLTGASLTGANLTGADLTSTVLDPCASPNGDAADFEQDGEYIIGYRTRRAGHTDKYRDGRFYSADWFSVCEHTECHPGLYLWPSLEAARTWSPSVEIIRVRTRPGEVHHVRSKWRCRWFEVLGSVDAEPPPPATPSGHGSLVH